MVAKFNEQHRFLRRSMTYFHQGDESEAARIAVTMRTLLIEKGSNRPVLGQLGVLKLMRFCDVMKDMGVWPNALVVMGIGMQSTDAGFRFIPNIPSEIRFTSGIEE